MTSVPEPQGSPKLGASEMRYTALLSWGALGSVLVLAALALRRVSGRFAYEVPFEQMPIIGFVMGYVLVAAIMAVGVPVLVRSTAKRRHTSVLLLIFVIGSVARLLQVDGSTLLEDDFYRYLWDGAVVNAGLSPFEYVPLDLIEGYIDHPALRDLVAEGAHVLNRVNHPEFRTVYPPALQAVFAVANAVAPWSLEGWRLVLFAFELGIAGLILAILGRLGQSPLWVALYWWNPLVIKEVANSAHMEPVLMLPVLGAVYLVLLGRLYLSTICLAIGAGVKLWPVMLVAAVLRDALRQPLVLLLCLGSVGAILAIMIWPIWLSGLDDTLGFVAFSKLWRASSAAILVVETMAAALPETLAQNPLIPRMFLGVVLVIAILVICARPAGSPDIVVRRMFWIVALIYLLAPSQTPWYFVWIAPFLCLFPVRGLILAGVTLPLHYLYFHLALVERPDLFRTVVVWAIWVPVWGLLLWDGWLAFRQRNMRGVIA